MKDQGKELVKLLERRNCIIALGGGAFINKNIREKILKNAISVWLDIDVKTLSERASRNEKRPLLENKDRYKKINELYLDRKNIYKLADHKIDCGQLSKENVVEKIIKIYEKHQNYSQN